MKIYHNCTFKPFTIPEECIQIEYRERCEVCGQVWKVIRRLSEWEGRRVNANFPNIKNWRWQRSVS